MASKVCDDYVRARLPDGSFQSEGYAFGSGGNYGGTRHDATIDKLKFLDVAHVIAGPLASRNYLPARDPAKTKLLIMVYWGTTNATDEISGSSSYQNASMAANSLGASSSASLAKSGDLPTTTFVGYHGLNSGNSNGTFGVSDDQLSAVSSALAMLHVTNVIRDRQDFFTASILGYNDDPSIGTEKGLYVRGTALGVHRDDLISDIEEGRYFVVLMAYDFQLIWKQKKHKLLWETRFSISERHNQFDKALPVMAQYAAPYFGEASNGLMRERMLPGHVEVGKPTLVELLPDKVK